MKRIFNIALVGAALAAALVSCQKEIEIVDQTGVTLDKSSVTLYPGEYYELGATITPSNATSNYLTWTSSDSKVAAVTGHGQVIAIAPAPVDKMGLGKATITATTVDGKVKATCEVTVNPINVTGVTLNKTATTVYIEANETLTTTVTPANASYKNVTWTSSNPDVATVDANGKVTGVDWGTAVITVTSVDGAKVASCTVTVEEADPTEAETLDMWKSDAAGQRKLFGAAGETIDQGWLKYANGTVTWEANTSGSPRTATIETSKGSKMTVTQIGKADFLGTMTLYAKLFDPNKTIGTGNVNANKASVTIAEAEGENGNNVTIKGLYHDAAVEAKVEIDYNEKTAKLGVYVSSKKFYNSGSKGYVALLPECAGSTWGSYNFIPKADKAFSDTNYDWLWFTYNIETKQIKYQYCSATSTTFVGQKTANNAYQICGLSFAKASETEITGANYDVIYQANYNGSNAESMYFMR